MNTAENLQLTPSPIPLALMVGVIGFSVFLSLTASLKAFPELAVGITYDLALTAPLFYYLAIRRTRIPKLTVALVFSAGLLTSFYLLPAEHRTHSEALLKFAVPVLELSLVGFVGFKTYKALSIYKRKSAKTCDLKSVLEQVCEELFGKSRIAKAVAFEASIFAYAFLPLRATESDGYAFSYSKQRGTNALFAACIFIVAGETLVLHFVISRWSIVAAWILTISSLYILVMFVAQFRALRKRPVEVLPETLVIRCGLFCEAVIPRKDIESVASFEYREGADPETYQAAFLKGFENMNVLINLKREATAYGPYWTKQNFKRMAFFVDQKTEFLQLISKHDTE